ncbi:MAG: hypothetical protein EPGJADBJ_01571 [Saprospiraceae bacterium]|nr:hypothetical protein [Saprospiraceae bacterium]
MLTAQPVLVKNINPGLSSGVLLGAARSALVGNTLYFSADDGTTGEELWKSDGTEAGTVLVRDICECPSLNGAGSFYTSYDGQLYLVGQTEEYGLEVWRTDDGPEGAVMLIDACPGDCSGAAPAIYIPLAVYKDKLYLNMGGLSGKELWVSDGTTAGTVLLKDINPNSFDSNPRGLTVFKDKLYFSADSAGLGHELWVCDGTAAGTTPVKNINPANFGSANINELVAGEEDLYFWAYENGNTGMELWKSDGTAAGTVLIKDINPGFGNGAPDYVPLTNSIWLDGKLLFVANDGATGEELWLTDGTETGTVLLKDINAGAGNSNIRFLSILDGKVFFRGNDGTNGNELWSTDGTEAGTQMLKNINPGAQDGLHFSTVHFTVFQNKMLFTANDGASGREIWITDGTTAGTQLFSDIAPGAQESIPSDYYLVGNTLLFFAQTQTTGRELWKYDLTANSANEPLQNIKANIWPTTSNDGVFTLQIESDAAETFRLETFDVAGRACFSQKVQSGTQQLNFSNLPSGAYFVHLIQQGATSGSTLRVSIIK